MLADFGFAPLQTGLVRRFVGRGVGSLLRQVLATLPSGELPAEADAFARFNLHYFAVNGSFARVYPGVIPGLDALYAGGWPLACVTNKPQRFVLPLLARTGLAKYFTAIVSGDTLPTMKPSAEPLLHACRALQAMPALSVMVGDSVHDAEAAKAAGIRSYTVPYGYAGEGFVESLPRERVLPRLDELPYLLAREISLRSGRAAGDRIPS